ncbi:hypothetical protein ACF1AE_09595 [Streptomyces sp. NPDC014986]
MATPTDGGFRVALRWTPGPLLVVVPAHLDFRHGWKARPRT